MTTTPLILLTIAFAFVHAINPQPCLPGRDNNGYNIFSRKHILLKDFDRTNTNEWQRYIENHGLINRSLQSFFESWDEERVKKICNGAGQPVISNAESYPANLCISHGVFPVYHVKLDQNNRVTNVNRTTQFVVLACDIVENQCLPVHYEKYIRQSPNRTAEPCRPR